MTLVIACKTRDGLLIAGEGKGVRKDINGLNESIEDAKKIVELGDRCVLLAYADGAEDYDEFLADLSTSTYNQHIVSPVRLNIC